MDKLKCQQVLELLEDDRIEAEIISPNYVAEYAYRHDIFLTSDEVVAVSYSYEGYK